MGSISTSIKGVEAMDAQIINTNELSASTVSEESGFYEELETVVRSNYRYLKKIAEARRTTELPGWYFGTKRGMDLFAGILGLILFSPFILIVAFFIKISSRGPVFYRQERVGLDGELFMMYKFRTMVTDAEKLSGPVWAKEDDPRRTFVGAILRKTKIDELPQLINLIQGNMTMVGPRPERPFFVNYFMDHVPGYSRRLSVMPGITGLAQLRNGYDQDAMDVIRKLRYDVNYIENMSLSMDLKLIVETFTAIFTGKA